MTNQYDHELAQFAKDGEKWWDLQGPFKPLHHINPARLSFIETQIALNGKSVIDLGCGGGILAEAMAAAGAHVHGIDLETVSLATAKAHAAQSGLMLDYEQISAEDLASRQPASADLVTCMEMLEHVPNPQSILAAAATLTKPGGKVICSTLNRHPKAFLLGIVAAEYLLGLVPRGTHHYRQFIKPSELSHMAASVGLIPQAIQGLSYNPLTGTATLSRDIHINYFLSFERTL